MGVISVTMFIGISYLATHIQGITVSEERSVVGQIAHAVFGGGFFFYFVQFFTTAILVLAANTSYQDFPRLSSILARDRFMPRQFANRGDRLVFSNGVIVLGAFASLLILVFDADLNRLIQLYVVGVFTSFTLSQTGMVRHWLKEKHKGEAAAKGWQRSIVINTIGAAATFLVLVIVTYTKFSEGAWIVIVAMPIIVLTFLSIHRHYMAIMAQLRRGHRDAGRLRGEPRRPAGARPRSVRPPRRSATSARSGRRRCTPSTRSKEPSSRRRSGSAGERSPAATATWSRSRRRGATCSPRCARISGRIAAGSRTTSSP